MKQIENVTSQQIGDVLKSTIKHAGLTQDEVGIKAGIPRNSLNRKLNGGTFNFDELARISQVAGRKLSDIIKDAEALADGSDRRTESGARRCAGKRGSQQCQQQGGELK